MPRNLPRGCHRYTRGLSRSTGSVCQMARQASFSHHLRVVQRNGSGPAAVGSRRGVAILRPAADQWPSVEEPPAAQMPRGDRRRQWKTAAARAGRDVARSSRHNVPEAMGEGSKAARQRGSEAAQAGGTPRRGCFLAGSGQLAARANASPCAHHSSCVTHPRSVRRSSFQAGHAPPVPAGITCGPLPLDLRWMWIPVPRSRIDGRAALENGKLCLFARSLHLSGPVRFFFPPSSSGASRFRDLQASGHPSH